MEGQHQILGSTVLALATVALLKPSLGPNRLTDSTLAFNPNQTPGSVTILAQAWIDQAPFLEQFFSGLFSLM